MLQMYCWWELWMIPDFFVNKINTNMYWIILLI